MSPKKKPAPDPKTCGACEHFCAEPREELGECYRNPPSLVHDGEEVNSYRPVVYRADKACGEFVRRLNS